MNTPSPMSSPAPLAYAQPSPADSLWGKGFLAVCGNAIFVGVGHWIAGNVRRGALWLLAGTLLAFLDLTAIIVPGISPALLLVLLLPVGILFVVGSYIDAFLCGRRSARPMLGRPWLRYAVGVLMLVIAVAVNAAIHRLMRAGVRAAGTQALRITTHAMMPTLRPGDQILSQRAGTIRRGDLVTFHPPTQPGAIFTSRVVGLPGEKVEVAQGHVRINDVPLDGPAGAGPYDGNPRYGPQTACAGHPIVLGPAEYFVLGDNSPVAFDSRYWQRAAPGHQLGVLPSDAILGRVTMIYWPIDRARRVR